jgi:hypothetical protein
MFNGMSKLEREAVRLQRRGTAFLKRCRILPMLRRIGGVEFTGGYANGLMANPDIDITVSNQHLSRDAVLKVLQALIKTDRFRGHLFYDFTIHRHRGFPRGWYIGLKQRFRGEKWKIDVWFVKTPPRSRLPLTKLTTLQRRTILKLKAERNRRDLDIPGWYIYRAVLEDGATSIAEVLRKLR